MNYFALAALLALAGSSCNTMIGIGRDFRQFGNGLENVAHGREFSDTGASAAPTY